MRDKNHISSSSSSSVRNDEDWTNKASPYCLPSLLDTGSTTESTDESSLSKSKQQKQQQRRQHRRQRCATLLEIIKRICIYATAIAAIASSVLSIFSCNFFSYTDITVSNTDDGGNDDGFTSAVENDNNINNEIDLGYQYTPFEFLNEAGVGLFAFYMGDPFFRSTATLLYKQEPMCFFYGYGDVLHEFHWFYNNYNPNNKGLWTRKIDLWIVARYCSIIAPIVALLGLLQLIVVENWFCRWHCCCRRSINLQLAAIFLVFGTFLSASLIQFGTFSIMFASPNLSSPSQSEGTTYQASFCFSTTSTYLCRIDTGAFFSLGSGLVYLILAFYSCNKMSGTTQRSAATDENDDNDNARTPSSSSKRKLTLDSEQRSDTSDSSSESEDSEDDDMEDIGHYSSNTLVAPSTKSKHHRWKRNHSFYNIQQRSSRLLAASFNPSVSKSKSLQQDHHDDYLEHETRTTIQNVLREKKQASSSSSSSSSSDQVDIVQEELDDYDDHDIGSITDHDNNDKNNNDTMVVRKTVEEAVVDNMNLCVLDSDGIDACCGNDPMRYELKMMNTNNQQKKKTFQHLPCKGSSWSVSKSTRSSAATSKRKKKTPTTGMMGMNSLYRMVIKE